MKNKVVFLLFLLLLSPINVLALENNISISCNKLNLKNNMETECKIQANNFNFITTSISGKVTVSDNLKIISSIYDNTKWKILDNKFDVKDINLISETKEKKEQFNIATFKIKAINDSNTNGEIKFTNVELGDEEYENHNINVESLLIELKYDKENEEIKENPTTNDLNIMIPITGTILLLAYSIYTIAKRKEN